MSDDGYDSSTGQDTGDPRDSDSTNIPVGDVRTRKPSWKRKLVGQNRSFGRPAFTLFVLGLILVVGGIGLPDGRPVLLALGGTGMFSGTLLYYLSTEPLLPAQVCTDTNSVFSRNERLLVQELDFQDIRIYVPNLTESTDGHSTVRLFVPSSSDYVLPTKSSTETLFMNSPSPNRGGIALYPSGTMLFRRFQKISTKKSVTSPKFLVEQVMEAVTDQFQLARTATGTVDTAGRRVTVEIGGSRLGRVDTFDHPTSSFIAVAFAEAIQKPIRVNVEQSEVSESHTLLFDFVEPERKPTSGRYEG
ncbi:hypothetical protein [Haladaptatus caseinilyticus]|uniref:hypothetical protein n=1 Tax=Haladaptatus caseinilyticus TaxID=2993314 RepID=UPI00224A8283|nr:hypothetical protein [Haladaptatus caseinilyticus]